MSSNEKKTYQEPDEIDLLLLLERVIIFFKKYKWLFAAAAAAGLLLGYIKYTSIPEVYKSRMVIRPFQLANQEEILIINNWDELLRKKEYPVLAAAFNCNENILPYIKKIRADEVQKVFSGTNPYGFFVDVIVTDNKVLDDLQKGILYGLENSEYVKDKIATRKSNLQDLIAKTTAEIEKLDSAKKTLTGIIEGKGKASSSLIVDGFSINRQMIDMQEKLLNYKEALQFANAVQVLQSFSKFRKPIGPNIVYWMGIGMIFFLVLAYAIALVHSVNMKLKARRQTNNIFPKQEQQVNELRIYK